MELSTPNHMVEDELLEEDDNPLRIDEPSFFEITEGEEPMPEQTALERLPRPVNELNCRQARTYLVKLLRNSNGGQNPHYGDPEMKPPFWPDFYWPWTNLTDVHTKPRGMKEPLQYSEMMKLAISRGYQYFGYDPNEYVDRSIEESKTPSAPLQNNGSPPVTPSKGSLEGSQPPRLIKPLSMFNCLHARTLLAKLLRYQQLGNNPVYGSPDTRPPWWPDDCIRWVDMVDLRGRPPYLPDSKTYTDVLKIAIERAYKYYGHDPETYLEGPPKNDLQEEEIDKIMNEHLKEYIPFADAPGAKHIKLMGAPPKLPIPVAKLNCGGARSCLSRLLRYRSGHQPPNYGNPQFMPSWWPNDIIDWAQIKNLSHRYEGYLGNSYSNCLRIALIRGYAHYGYDANTFVDDPNGGSSAVYWHMGDPQNSPTEKAPKMIDMRTEKCKKPMPHLRLIENSSASPSNSKDLNIPALLSNLQPVPCQVRFHNKVHPLLEFMHQDYLKGRRYTDTILVSSTGQRFKVHGLVLRLLSPQMSALLADLPEQSYNFILFPDISSDVLKLLIHAFYTGEVILEGEAMYVGVLRAKNFLSEMGLLANFQGSPLTAPPKSIIEEEEEETPSTIDLQSPSLPEDDSDNFEGSQGSKDEMNFDDIIEAVATKIEEEEKAVQSSQGGVRRSFRTRRRKELPDFELGGGSDLDSPPPIIKTEPLDESDIPESIVCDLPEIKLENPDGNIVSPSSVRRSSRTRKRQMPELLTPPNKKPVQISLKRSRHSNKPKIEDLNVKTLDTTFKEGGAKALSSLLMKKGFLSEKPPKCSSCGNHTSLQSDPQAEDGLLWRCSSSKHSDISLRTNSIFEGSSESLHWIMKIIICWSENTSLNQCHQLYGADVDKIFYWYDKCKGFYGALS